MTCEGGICKLKADLVNLDVSDYLTTPTAQTPEVTEQVLIRLGICQQCDFRSQHTCTKSGSFYEYRANDLSASCPIARW